MVGSVESREVRLDLGFSRVWGRSRRKREDLSAEDWKAVFSARKRSKQEGKVCGKGVLVFGDRCAGGKWSCCVWAVQVWLVARTERKWCVSKNPKVGESDDIGWFSVGGDRERRGIMGILG